MESNFWDDKRAPGAANELHEKNYESVVEVIESAFTEHADKNAFTALGRTMTFRELEEASRDFAAYLQNHTDLQKGDRIAIQMPSVLQYLVVLYGALRSGLVIVNTNPLYTPREMKHQFNDAGVRALVYMDMYGKQVQDIIDDTDIKYLFQSSMGDMLTFPKRQLINAVVKYVRKGVPEFSLENVVQLKSALSLGKKASYKPVDIKSDDVALLQYTGGTTGVAKGAVILNSNLVAQVRQVRAAEGVLNSKGEQHVFPGEEILVCPLPLYHIYAFTVHCVASFSRGNHSVLITDPRNTDMFVRALSKWKFTTLVGINTLFVSLLEHPKFASLDFSALRTTISGGAALNQDTADRWKAVTGSYIAEGYGLTEASPTVCTSPVDGQGKSGTVGIPIVGTALKVIDEEGKELGFNEPGELCIKGPQIMAGYWQRPEETEKVLVDGWLKTGDIAEIDKDGYVSLVDRKKDMILVSGFNVFPNEIEDVIALHNKVEMCACIGVPCDKSGEVPKVFIVKSDSSLTEEELKGHCKKNLTNYKQPKHYVFVDELPMTAVGKVLRKELRALESA